VIDAGNWPYLLGGVIVLALIVLVLLVLLLRRSARAASIGEREERPDLDLSEPLPEPELDDQPSGGMRSVFRRAKRLFKQGPDDRYHIPFTLLMGSEESRDADLLGSAGLDLPFGAPSEARLSLGNGRGFWFFDHGVVLDVAGPQVLRTDGRTSDDDGWRTILNLLVRVRPKRPIDSVAIAIPAAALLGAMKSDVERSDLAARAARIYRKVAELQQHLGFRLPAYIVVTGSERLSGFASLAASLPLRSRGEMFGWSTPYAVDAAYRGEWIDEAVTALVARVEDLQMEVFAEGTRSTGALLQLPHALRAIGAPLRAVIDQIFRSSAYQSSLVLRGIYFCGRDAEEQDARHMTAQTAFLADLFDRKVFLESGLALPSSRVVSARNGAVRAARFAAIGAAVLFAGGLVSAFFSLTHKRDQLIDFLQQTKRDVQWVRAHTQGDEKPEEGELQMSAANLLHGMAAIDFNTFSSIFVPPSWPRVTSLDEKIQSAIGGAFQEVILKAIRRKLDDRAQQIISNSSVELAPASLPVTPPPGGSVEVVADPLETPAAVALEDLPSFKRLQKYLADLRQLEVNGVIFNDLGRQGAGDLKDLGALVKYAFGTDLPENFYTRAHLYERPLQNLKSDPFDFDRFQAPARGVANDLASSVYHDLYDQNPFAARLQQLTASLQALANDPPAAGETDRFALVARQMRAVEASLTRPELEWAFRRDFGLGPAYTSAIAEMQRSPLIGPLGASEIRERGVTGWKAFRQLLTFPAPVVRSIVSVDNGEPRMQLSADALLLKAGLDTFLVQGFVSSPQQGHRVQTELPQGRRLAWDAPLLEQSAAVGQAYDRFRQNTLRLFPSELRNAIDGVARERARAQMADLLGGAERFEPVPPMNEEELRTEVSAFAASIPPLNDVLDGFTRLGFTEPRRDVAYAVTAEGARLLQATDHLLQADAPYRPRGGGFSWWDGTAPPAPAAWDAHDGAELAAYLDTTRTRVALLARNYAQPLLTWLTKAGTRDRSDVGSLATKWQSIVDDLRDYDGKKPGNAVATLDDYISVQLVKLRPSDCSAASLPSGFRGGRGFFAATLQDLSRDVSTRCLAMTGHDANARYSDLARFFNQRLAGRYPFADTPPGSDSIEADPADIRGFFKIFDAGQSVIRAMPSDGAFAPARRFVDDMAAVRSFFAPFVDGGKPDPAPSFDVEPTFRVLREREVEGAQIIGWTLSVGDDSVTNRDKTRKLRWTAGKPLRLSLRWAANAPNVPTLRAPQRGATVRERTVVYDYDNRWSLLTALSEHRPRAEQLPSYADVQPVTLAVSVDTKPAAAGSPPAGPTLVFLRLAVLAPGTTQSVDVPRFPARAPKIEGDAQ
jgi:type VI secretion system protein ImpL